MKISFSQYYIKNKSSELQNQIKSHIQKSLEDLGDMEFYVEKLGSIIVGVNNALKELSQKQYPDTIHLDKKVIDLDLTNNTRSELVELIEEYVDIAMSRRIHSTTLERISDYVMEAIELAALKQNELLIPVSTNQELAAIIEYVEERWDGFDKVDINAFFNKIWDISLNLSKHKIDHYAFLEVYEEWKEERKNYSTWDRAGTKLKEKEVSRYKYDDFINNFIDSLISAPHTFDKIIMEKWDYSKNVTMLLKEIKAEFPNSTKLRPKGWKKLAKDYNDFDGQEEYCDNQQEIDDAAFKGINSGTAGSFPFQARVALPYVMYDDKCQGRKPLQTLVGAVLAHAYAVNVRNNTATVLNEISDLKVELNGSEYYQNIVLNVDLDSKIKSPVMKALYAVIKDRMPITSEEEFDEMLKADREAAKKPKDNTPKEPFDMAAFMKDVMNKEKDPLEVAKEKEAKIALSEKVWSILESGENKQAKKPKMK